MVSEIPRVQLANLPTPVHRLDNVGRELGITDLWVKRDDLTGTLYGGNKVRKLEFLLADAMEKGHGEVWTVGAIGSHHVLATCIYARELGLGCGALHFPQPVTPHVRKNILALSSTRPNIHLLTRDQNLAPQEFGRLVSAWLREHPDVYYIPGGGSSPIGALGYVEAALELVQQVEEGVCPRPDRIYVAAGTCGTIAGLVAGFALADFDVELVGVRVVDLAVGNEARVMELVEAAWKTIGARAAGTLAERFRLSHDFIGEGYGLATPAALQACELAALDHLTLEPTYTAKAFSAVVADAPGLAERTILYWHTLSGADLSGRTADADLDALPPDYRAWTEEEA